MIEQFRPWVLTTASMLVNQIEPGSVDIIGRLTEPLPVMAIAHLLGLEMHQWPTLKRWSSSIIGIDGVRDRGERFRDVLDAHHFFSQQVQIRKESPVADLISYILHQTESMERLTQLEVQAYCILLLVAGNETTNGLMGNLLNVLANDRKLWDELRAGRIAITSVVDEALRYDSPVQIVRRVVKRDAEINGLHFRQGDLVEACLGSANRDPLEFLDPERFEPMRDFRRHIAFGHGIHYCLGAPLARMIAGTALSELLARFKTFRSVRRGNRISSYALSGFASLPIELKA
jgi:cytochrome P450